MIPPSQRNTARLIAFRGGGGNLLCVEMGVKGPFLPYPNSQPRHIDPTSCVGMSLEHLAIKMKQLEAAG